MIRPLRSLLNIALIAVAIQVVGVSAAYAHHPNIEIAGVRCDGTSYVVSYKSTSWTIGDSGTHLNIDILVNGSLVATGQYTAANGYQFSGEFTAPNSGLLSVTAFADGWWGALQNVNAGGQSATATTEVPVEPCGETSSGTGRFTGGGKQVDVGVAKVTRGLTIHCDRLLSNNLEINWGVANHFHMTEHTTTIVCSDDPRIEQRPPNAPLDTLEGTGTGRFNGKAGYSIRFTLVDAGEPGRNDQMWFEIWETLNPANRVLTITPGSFLTTGNLQAHYDQPHKNK
jgi:hypothetical protein